MGYRGETPAPRRSARKGTRLSRIHRIRETAHATPKEQAHPRKDCRKGEDGTHPPPGLPKGRVKKKPCPCKYMNLLLPRSPSVISFALLRKCQLPPGGSLWTVSASSTFVRVSTSSPPAGEASPQGEALSTRVCGRGDSSTIGQARRTPSAHKKTVPCFHRRRKFACSAIHREISPGAEPR